jgi:ribosomal 50S subunit-recycling heat shock protein
MTEGDRLNKALASAGVGSRRHCDALIAAGRVSINGQRVIEPGRRMEQGELKVRVRNLDAERSFKRLELLGAVQGNAVVGSIFLNLALLLGSRSVQVPSLRLATKLAFAVATFCGLQLPFSILKLKKLERGAFSD